MSSNFIKPPGMVPAELESVSASQCTNRFAGIKLVTVNGFYACALEKTYGTGIRTVYHEIINV